MTNHPKIAKSIVDIATGQAIAVDRIVPGLAPGLTVFD